MCPSETFLECYFLLAIFHTYFMRNNLGFLKVFGALPTFTAIGAAVNVASGYEGSVQTEGNIVTEQITVYFENP